MLDFNESKVTIKEETGANGTYEIKFLPRGYGHTLANALRRIALSSMRGFGVTSIKIDGVKHEYTAIKGVREDVLEILLNIKDIIFASTLEEQQVCHLEVSGKKIVTAGDIKTTQAVSIVNKDLEIMHLTSKDSKLSMEIVVESGIGYKEADEGLRSETGRIPLGVNFSPVKLFNFQVDHSRKGQETQLDAVSIEIITDGAVKPREILIESCKTLQNFSGKVMVALGVAEKEVEELVEESVAEAEMMLEADSMSKDKDVTLLKIDELELATRIKTILADSGYDTLADILKSTVKEIEEMPGFGKKSFEELRKLVESYGLSFKEE